MTGLGELTTVVKCPKCGREIEKEGHRCCNACSLKHDAIRRGEGGLRWEFTVPVVMNSLIWRDLIVALGIPVLIMAGIIVVFSHAPDRFMILAFFGVLYAVFLLIALVVLIRLSRSLGGGLCATFYVNNAGVGYEAGDPAKTISRGTLALSFVSGLIRPAGTHLLAIAQEENFIPWRDISGVKIYHHPRVVQIQSIEMIPIITLYCTPDNFSRVTAMIGKKLPQASVR